MATRGLYWGPRPAGTQACRRPGRQPGHPWRHFQRSAPPTTPVNERGCWVNWDLLRPPTAEERSQFFPERLRAHAAAWAEAGASACDLRIITEGLRLPFASRPPPPFHLGVSLPDATPEQRAWLLQHVQLQLSMGVYCPARSRRYVSRCHLVPKGAEWRLVFDGRHLNRYLRDMGCRYETARRLCTMLQRGDWMVSLDLASGFHHVPIHPAFREFLTFEIDGLGHFECCALPFGLNISPYFFTKLMRTFVRCLRAPLARRVPDLGTSSRSVPPPRRQSAPSSGGTLPSRYVPPHRRQSAPSSGGTLAGLAEKYPDLMRRGLRVLPYMDDFLTAFRTREAALEGRQYISDVLALLGLSRHPTKGEWEPTQRLKHLGLGIDTTMGLFFVTPDRLEKLSAFATSLLYQACSPAGRGLLLKRRVAAFAGLAQSLYLALPLARYRLRSLHDMCRSTAGWTGSVRLTTQARRDLQFADLEPRYNGRPIWRSPHTALLHCDASKLGWGAVFDQTVPARGFWTPHERRQHITFLELRAVRYGIQAFARHLRGRHVLLREDNQAVVSVLTHLTSWSPPMMRELRLLWRELDTHDITLRAHYIRSGDNWWADSLSREADKGDWRLQRRWFLHLDSIWGPHTVDRFASRDNTHLPRFNTAWWDPQAEGLDAFAQSNWASELNWCHPPCDDRILDRLVQLLSESGAAATVVVPQWPAQPWYQRLQELCIGAFRLPAETGLFSHGSRTSSAAAAPPPWSVVAFRVPARAPHPGSR